MPVPIQRQAAQALPPELIRHYDYERLPLQATIESTEQKSGYRKIRLHLAPSDSSGPRPITVDWYKSSKPGKLPVVLLSPILAGNDLYVREFARFYAARGMHGLIVYRQKEVFSADRDLKDLEKHFQESILQVRRVLDWLETEESVDAERIGSFGISLGAILTAILAAVEPRIQAHILGLPAGDLPEIIMTSKDKAIRKRRRAYLEKQGWNEQQALDRLRELIVSEPLRFAPAVDPKRVLMIAGVFDRVLGFHRCLHLWQKMGRPRLILLPTGHYTAYLTTPYLKIATYSFLRRNLSVGSDPVGSDPNSSSRLR